MSVSRRYLGRIARPLTQTIHGPVTDAFSYRLITFLECAIQGVLLFAREMRRPAALVDEQLVWPERGVQSLALPRVQVQICEFSLVRNRPRRQFFLVRKIYRLLDYPPPLSPLLNIPDCYLS